jgi:TonB family protein
MKTKFVLASMLAAIWANGASAAQEEISLSFLNPAPNRAAELSLYSSQVKKQIESHWHNIGEESARDPVEVLFQIRPNGSLLNAKITRSSGVAQFDQGALDAVTSCVPFQSPPLGEVRLLNVIGRFGPMAAAGNPPTGQGHPAEQSSTNIQALTSKACDQVDTGGAAAEIAQNTELKRLIQTSEQERLNQVGELEHSTQDGRPEPLIPLDEKNLRIHAGVDKTVLSGDGGASSFQGSASNTRLLPRTPEADQTPIPLSTIVQSKKPIELSASHGYAAVGVLGFEWEMLSKRIIKIFPGSDLLNYGIVPGDRILAEDGNPVGFSTPKRMRGEPGTYVQVTILHNGQVINAQVQRKDAAEFASYHAYYKHWASKSLSW